MQRQVTGKSLLATLRRHWLVLLLGYVLAFIDPFGINSKTSKAISDAFDRLFSPIYSAATTSNSADLVDVILIDDRSIQILSNDDNGYIRANDWPLAYSDYGVLIDALRQRGYGTVVLDITFYRERSLDRSFKSLVTRLEHLRKNAGVAVILSAGSEMDELEESILPLKNAATGLGLTGWSGHGDNYPLRVVLDDGASKPTLAAAGYQAYCRKTNWCGCDLSKAKNNWLVDVPPEMHMAWGRPARRTTASLQCRASEEHASWVEVLSIGWRNLWGAETVSSGSEPVCPPIPTATLSDVFCSGADCDPFFRGDGAQPERIAMVGVSLPSAWDLFDPPIRGRLPGVYLHAEALRNLLRYGQDYIKPLGLRMYPGFPAPRHSWFIPVDLLLGWPLLLWGVVRLAPRFRIQQIAGERQERWQELLMGTFEIVLMALLLALVYGLALSWWHRTPGFLADLIGLTPLLLIAVRHEQKEI